MNSACSTEAEWNRLARRYVWWRSPEEARADELHLLAQIMNWGTWDDIRLLSQLVGEGRLKDVLHEAPPGIFSLRRWNYWHVRFGIYPTPPLPQRFQDQAP